VDSRTGVNLIQWPIEEVNALRGAKQSKTDVKLEAGAVVEVEHASGGQVEHKSPDQKGFLASHSNVQIEECSCIASKWSNLCITKQILYCTLVLKGLCNHFLNQQFVQEFGD
jgi:hypothetical protein